MGSLYEATRKGIGRGLNPSLPGTSGLVVLPELLRLRAEQHGVDVEQRVTRAGEVVARVDSVSGLHGPETLLFESDVSGPYLVHVQAIGGRGEVRLDVEELGKGSDASRSLLAARRLLDRQERRQLATRKVRCQPFHQVEVVEVADVIL